MGNNNLLSKSFLWMTIGLLLTFATGYIISINDNMVLNVFGGSFWVWIVLELVLVVVLSLLILKMSPIVAKICFLIYSFVSGVTFSSVFIAYNLNSIMMVFLVAALLFGVMSFVGYKTNVDLSKIGFYLLMALLGVIAVSIINLFLNSTELEMILSAISVLLFIGITAYDVQKIKRLEGSGLPEDSLAIYGALELYLDFLDLLRLLGNNKD